MSQPIVCDTLDQQCFLAHPGGGDNGAFPEPPPLGGAQQVYSGHGEAGALIPDDPTLPAIYFDQDAPYATEKWDVDLQAWT